MIIGNLETTKSDDFDEGTPTTKFEKQLDPEAVTGSKELPPSSGADGWLTVAGSWLILFSTLGYIYSFGVYQDFYTRTFLPGHSPSSIAWMGSLQIALPFLGGPIAGKIFDAGYIRSVMVGGSALFAFCVFMLSLAQQGHYYQILLSQGIGLGLGGAMVFTPTTAIVNLHFRGSKRKSLAYGTALSGTPLGSTIFPIVLNRLIARQGFAPAVRASGYVALACLITGNLLIRLPAGIRERKAVKLDVKKFSRDAAYSWQVFGFFIAVFGAYFPSIYLQNYAVEHRVDNTLAFYSIAMLNGASAVARIGGNHLADVYGIWNMLVPCTVFTGATIWAMLGVNSAASLIVVSILYGLFSGAWFSLTMAGIASLASTPQEVGARVGVGIAITSISLLVSAPLQGALLTADFHWVRPIAFSGSLVFLAAFLYSISRWHVSRNKRTQRV